MITRAGWYELYASSGLGDLDGWRSFGFLILVVQGADRRVNTARQNGTVPPARSACGAQAEIDLGGVGSCFPDLLLPTPLGPGPFEWTKTRAMPGRGADRRNGQINMRRVREPGVKIPPNLFLPTETCTWSKARMAHGVSASPKPPIKVYAHVLDSMHFDGYLYSLAPTYALIHLLVDSSQCCRIYLCASKTSISHTQTYSSLRIRREFLSSCHWHGSILGFPSVFFQTLSQPSPRYRRRVLNGYRYTSVIRCPGRISKTLSESIYVAKVEGGGHSVVLLTGSFLI